MFSSFKREQIPPSLLNRAVLASNLLGQIFVDASGGQFYNSPEQLRQYVEGKKEVEAYPDAGDVSNRHVILRWRKIKDLLTEWGISIKFALWDESEMQKLPFMYFVLLRD